MQKRFTHIVNHLINLGKIFESDTIKVNKEMTKASRDHSHYEQSSQQSSQDPTKDLADLTRKSGYRPEPQMFFLLSS